jgi:hypothetical protein
MIVALIDNGSLEPAAAQNLRTVAAAVGARLGLKVHAVSWKHSDRIAAAALDGSRAWTLLPFVRSMLALGQRDFVFLPFFISAQGAIGSALRRDLETLQREVEGSFSFVFAESLTDRRALAPIVTARIRETIVRRQLQTPAVIVVDHGGPSAVSAAIRDDVAAEVRTTLGPEIGRLAAASMEGAEHAHNRPLLVDLLPTADFNHGDVVIAPLFLSPGRHAGPHGDLARFARAAEDRVAGAPLRCHVTDLVGTHPHAVEALAASLRAALTALPTKISA